MKPNLRSLPLLALRPLACLIASGQLFTSNALAGTADDIISINDVTIAEGNSGTSTLTFTVTRSTNTADFTLSWATADGSGATAAVAPADYTAGNGILNFTQGGALSETISVTVKGDTSPELDETFLVNLSSLTVTNGTASLADAQGQGTITDDDRIAPVITTNPASTISVVAGTSFTLTAAASGTPAPTYQWYIGTPGITTTPVSGATAATLTTSTAIDRSYWVRATNSKGTADSTATSVTVPSATNALLSGLTLNTGTISPVFNAVTFAYSASEAENVTSVAFTPTVAISGATLTAAINGGAATPVPSGSPIAVTLNTGTNTVALKVTATDSTTTKTYNLSVVRAPQVYTSTNRDILEPNRRNWPTAGVSLGNTRFINLGLQGVGRVPANAIDAATGESLGSISDMQVTGFTKNPDGSYSGTLQTLPDRGYNSGTVYSNYAARLNTFTFNFTPYTSVGATTAQNQLALTFTGSTRFTYDHDGDLGTPSVFTSGQLANGPAVNLFGTTIPVVAGITTQSDGPVTNRLTLDAEGLILDSRAGKSGSGWIGDEYGAYIYHFNAAKQLDGQLQLPAALVPHSPVGTNNHLIDPPLNGRRINQGVEGIAQSPDGSRLFALLQSATIQDSGTGNQGRSNTRLLVYDISSSDAPSDPIAQYVIQLPRADDTGSASNGNSVNRNCAQSSILALSNTQFLVLARDGNGRGVAGSSAPVFKSILLADVTNATNIDGTYDAEGNAVAPAGTLTAGVTPIAWTEALNLIGKLNPSQADVEKFGLNLQGGNGDINTICEKWEALAMVPANDPVYPNDYFLFVGNDNDFLSATGKYMDSNGAIQSYDGGLENDTIVLAYRVRAAAATPATIVSAGDTTQTTSVLWASSKRPGTVTFTWSKDATFATGIASTSVTVTDITQPVKVAVTGLTPNSTYYYRAVTSGDTATGQFKTAAPTTTLAGLRFGVSGDQRGELAPFPSIKNAAGKNLEFFMQLGDNIYGDVATPDLPTAQARTLSDFRIRHNEIYSARYGMNTFTDLRRTTSILATIDDHEVTNDFSGGEPRTSDSRFSADTGSLISDTETFNNGVQAFREYMPIQNLQYGATGDVTTANRAKLYRYNTYGKDAATFMLDTRSFRSAPVASITNPTDPAQIGAFLAASFAPGRTLLGAAQKADLKADLLSAKAAGITWKFIFCPEPIQNFGPLGGEDRYEGYAAERTEILKYIDDNQITNVVFVSADFHGTAVNRLSYQLAPGQPQIQTNSIEIITGAVAYDKPFGPTIVDLATAFGLISGPQRAFYDSLTPAQALQKEGFVQSIINGTLNALGYNPLTLFTNPLPTVTLASGAYTATHSYGWTEFSINATTQKLNLKTWGIAPYSQEELDADPLAITSRTPAIVQELDLTPKPLINAAATAGLAVAADTSPINLSAAAGVSPPGGTFSGNGIAGDTFDPALAPLGANTITYTVAGQSASFTITTSAAPVIPAAPTNALTASLKSSIVLSDNGLATGNGGAEIPAFDPASKRAFAASNAGVQVVNLANPSAPIRLAPIDPTVDGVGSKDVSHVIVKNGVLAVSLIASPDKTLPGKVAFYDASTSAFISSVTVGANPDQLTFTPDGSKILVANEGEMALASTNPLGGNPDGSVSIIDVSGGFIAPPVTTANFAAWNGQEDALRARGVRVFPGNSAQIDLEPEYIAIAPDGLTALVTLQEANAVALLDIASATFTAIKPLGLKNFAPYKVDFSDRDGSGSTWSIKPVTGLPVYGMFMPDGISSYQSGGQTYYVTSNEGDDRNDFLVPAETIAVAATTSVTVGGVTTTTPVYDLDNTLFPTETTLKGNAVLGRLSVSNVPGLRGDLDNDGDIDRILSYGGRSFSILDANGKRIFDSGDLIDRILTDLYPALYDDSRSDNKSAEPEGVSIAVLDGKTYAFIGLERSHSVLVFDVTDPTNVTFTTLATRAGDLNPEGMLNISAADSPTGKPLLLVANEVSYTLTTYEIAAQTPALRVQLLHYYGESGLLGIQTAPLMGALIDKFDDQYASTLVIGEGDSFIPGPWLVGGADPSLNRLLHTGTFTTAADSTATPMGQADIAIMNAFNTTVSALGNHEFDLGSPVLAGALVPAASTTLGNWSGALFPIITANLDFASDSSLRGFADTTLGGTTSTSTSGNYRGAETSAISARIAPYAIKTIGGEKVGFVGATTWDLLSKSSPNGTRPKDDANNATSDLQEVAAYVQSAINALKVTGVNKIIMVDQLDTLQRNKDLAPLLTGVDVMIAGGGHERMGDSTDTAVGFNGHDADFIGDAYPIVTAGADGKPTLIVTTDTEYSYIGRLVVNFDANGELVLSALDPAVNGAYAATPATVEAVYNNGQTAAQIVAASPMATRVKTITDAINTVIQTKDGLIYGYTRVYMEGDRVFGRTQEVNLGDVTADANATKAKTALGLPATAAVFSLKNGGGLRASLGSVAADGSKIPPLANPLTGKPAGAISRLDVENALRFDNKLVVFDTTPAGLLGILNFAAGLSSGPTVQSGGYPQVGNIRFSYEASRPAGQKVRSAVLIDDNGKIVNKIVENGAVLPGAPATIPVVALNFTANGGDGYPIKYLDPAATTPNTIVNNETSNFRFLLSNGTLSAPLARNLDFTAATVVPANALGEQQAFSDYLTIRHNSMAKAYDQADTAVALDTRIQQIPSRTDTVLYSPVEIWRLVNFGNAAGSGPNQGILEHADTDGVNNLFEFAFGTDPVSNVTGAAALTYSGTLAGNGTLTLPGQPITKFEPIANNVDFRAVFVRRKDYLAAGLTYTPQFSSSLGSWQDSSAVPTVLADDGTWQVVSVPYTRSIAGRKAFFFRIAVDLAPAP
jgi:phosphodiesterase/alkaline phosphatase D-like protein/2',3'-cyclic-nucleotide 2'-phosphodiesterase (5'-nucleotidase family)